MPGQRRLPGRRSAALPDAVHRHLKVLVRRVQDGSVHSKETEPGWRRHVAQKICTWFYGPGKLSGSRPQLLGRSDVRTFGRSDVLGRGDASPSSGAVNPSHQRCQAKYLFPTHSACWTSVGSSRKRRPCRPLLACTTSSHAMIAHLQAPTRFHIVMTLSPMGPELAAPVLLWLPSCLTRTSHTSMALPVTALHLAW